MLSVQTGLASEPASPANAVNGLANSTSVPLRHNWQEDEAGQLGMQRMSTNESCLY